MLDIHKRQDVMVTKIRGTERRKKRQKRIVPSWLDQIWITGAVDPRSNGQKSRA